MGSSDPLQIIPAIDLMCGQVVRGRAGRRAEYRPLVSRLAGDARPETVGQAFFHLGYRLAYVADLDAIAGAAPASALYHDLADSGLALWVDAGVGTTGAAEQFKCLAAEQPAIQGIVCGLESLPDAECLARIVDIFGTERTIFSLDMQAGRPIAEPGWNHVSPLEIVTVAVRLGIPRLIVLDLADVGMGQGTGTLALCGQLARAYPRVEIIAGGGVRGPEDLTVLAQAGCSAALVASALHDGHISPRVHRIG